ncbi:activating signal cointegrator 1 complex subunit 2, partial [Asbolus verrucosus]
MEELSEVIKRLDLESFNEDVIEYEHINVFKNPNKLPINQIHLEKVSLELRKDAPVESLKSNDDLESKCFERKTQIIPALFWCLVLFEPKVGISIHSFLLSPILPHQIKDLDEESASVYLAVFSQFRRLYERLTTFQETEDEYMVDSVGLKYLLDKKLLNLPVVITLILLYHETNLKFVNDLVSLYFNEESLFRDKEIEEMLTQDVMTLEMIGGHVCGFEPGAVIVPIAIEEKPPVFNLNWVYSVVSYLLNTISTLHMLLKFYKPATAVALAKGVPYRLSYTYENVFHRLYDYLNERKELEQNPKLSEVVFKEVALGRSEFIDVYNTFISYCLDKTLEFSGDSLRQQEFVEIYLKLMTTALEDEYFICDYHERYDVGTQNEMFSSCTDLYPFSVNVPQSRITDGRFLTDNRDETRTDYILNCITSLRRHSRIWKTLKCELKTLHKAIEKYANSKKIRSAIAQQNGEAQPGPSNNFEFVCPSEDEIEEAIKIVIDMFPHLGDGFVLQCLEAYNYQPTDVISAILEENLPPHIIDIPFDTIRIPPEPKPVQPILEYSKGKKPDYDDALKLLNDKKDIKEIKTFILDGIQFTNEYDVYDDEYDDRIDDAVVAVPDHGSEDILKFNPNYEDVVSDTSYSENEYDDKGEPVVATSAEQSKSKNFCEDPALIRARREARWRNQGQNRGRNPGKSNDVVGKTKGQGQDKNVLQNRQKKSAHKSSRANHSRKSGAQWKRNKGMVP